MRNIVFWRGIEEASFKPTEGGFLYYPYGSFRGGYVVTAEQKASLVAFIRSFYLASTILIVVQALLAPFFGLYVLLGVVVVLAALLAWFYLGVRARLVGAARSNERLSLGEAQRLATQTMSSGRIATILVLGVLLIIGSAFTLTTGLRTDQLQLTLSGGFGLVFFGFCLLMGCYNAWLKWGRHA